MKYFSHTAESDDPYIVDIKTDIETLRKAISSGDLQAIQEISHRLKGTTGNLRLNEVSLEFAELNDLSKNKEALERYPALFAKIESGIKDYCQALNI